MTTADFLAFYPQFAGLFPEAVLTAFVNSSNLRFEQFDEDAEEARRLYVAHKLTLYARTMPASSQGQGGVTSFSALSSSGDVLKVAAKRVDDVSVTYASGASSSASSRFADLTETEYGLQLISLFRLHSESWYVP